MFDEKQYWEFQHKRQSSLKCSQKNLLFKKYLCSNSSHCYSYMFTSKFKRYFYNIQQIKEEFLLWNKLNIALP